MCIAEKSLSSPFLSLSPLPPAITPTNDAAHYSTKNLKINKPYREKLCLLLSLILQGSNFTVFN